MHTPGILVMYCSLRSFGPFLLLRLANAARRSLSTSTFEYAVSPGTRPRNLNPIMSSASARLSRNQLSKPSVKCPAMSSMSSTATSSLNAHSSSSSVLNEMGMKSRFVRWRTLPRHSAMLMLLLRRTYSPSAMGPRTMSAVLCGSTLPMVMRSAIWMTRDSAGFGNRPDVSTTISYLHLTYGATVVDTASGISDDSMSGVTSSSALHVDARALPQISVARSASMRHHTNKQNPKTERNHTKKTTSASY